MRLSRRRSSSCTRCKPHDRTNKTSTNQLRSRERKVEGEGGGDREGERDDSSPAEERWSISRYSAHMDSSNYPTQLQRHAAPHCCLKLRCPRISAESQERIHKCVRLFRKAILASRELQLLFRRKYYSKDSYQYSRCHREIK